MSNWYVEFDGINGCFANWYYDFTLNEIIAEAEMTLQDLDGGHADIFDEDDNFIKDIEI